MIFYSITLVFSVNLFSLNLFSLFSVLEVKITVSKMWRKIVRRNSKVSNKVNLLMCSKCRMSCKTCRSRLGNTVVMIVVITRILVMVLTPLILALLLFLEMFRKSLRLRVSSSLVWRLVKLITWFLGRFRYS